MTRGVQRAAPAPERRGRALSWRAIALSAAGCLALLATIPLADDSVPLWIPWTAFGAGIVLVVAGLRTALLARRHARARPEPGAAGLSLVAALLGWLGVLILALLVALLALLVFVVAPRLA